MSAAAVSGSPPAGDGPPVVNQAGEPAWVRKGSAATQKAYETALGFEEMLVEELSQSLAASSGLGGESGEEGEGSEAGSLGGGGAGGPFASMLPGALTSGVMSAGGLGLAAQMTRQLQGAAGAAPAETGAATTGGTGATAPASGSAGSAPASNNAGAVPAAAAGTSASASGDVAATGGTPDGGGRAGA